MNISARSLGDCECAGPLWNPWAGGGHQTMAAAQLKHITPEAARARIQTAIDQYRAAQKKSVPDTETKKLKSEER